MEWDIQVAIYNNLKADTTLMTLIDSKIYDEPPTNLDYPYIVIGDISSQSDNMLDYQKQNTTCNIVVYDKPESLGYYNVKKIADRIKYVLDHKKFSVNNATNLICKFGNFAPSKKDDIRFCIVRFDLILVGSAISF